MILVFIIIIFLIILYLITNKKCISLKDQERIQSLIKQSSRYSIASLQDENISIAILHANYGAAYLYALLDIYSEKEISNSVDINLLKFKKEIQNIQAEATKRMYSSCPGVIPKKYSEILTKASQIKIKKN